MPTSNVIDVKVINLSPTLPLPKYQTPGAACVDLQASFDNQGEDSKLILYSQISPNVSYSDLESIGKLILYPGDRALVPTNLKVQLPEGYELQVRPRSGNALKKGMVVLNSPGTVDCDYRGVVGVILYNAGFEPIEIRHGDRIAQAKLSSYSKISFTPTESLDDSTRAGGGFGHTDEKR